MICSICGQWIDDVTAVKICSSTPQLDPTPATPLDVHHPNIEGCRKALKDEIARLQRKLIMLYNEHHPNT